MTDTTDQPILSLAKHELPSDAFREHLATYLLDPEIRETAHGIFTRSVQEMHAAKGNDVGLIAVFCHVLGEVAALYRVTGNIDLRAAIFTAIGESIERQLPELAARMAEIDRARPRIIT